MNSINFTEDESDLVSKDFLFSKVTINKKLTKKRKVQKQVNKNESTIDIDELTDEQKDILQKNAIVKERLITIEKLLKMYPNLKKDKQAILECVLGKKEMQKRCEIFEKIPIKNKNIYKDNFGNIFDQSVNLVGFWFNKKNEFDKFTISYIFFDEIDQLKIKITKTKNNLLKSDYKDL